MRAQGAGEEFANAASHGLGFVLALLALPLLAAAADAPPAPRGVAGHGALVFVATMLLVYLVSALYHGVPDGAHKRRLQRIDHAAIFVFIAGSWTPFALHAGVEPAMFALVWGTALCGAALKLADRLRDRITSTSLYIAFGWLALIAVGPLGDIVQRALPWLVGGGIAYSIGTVFFLLDGRLRYGHLVWHLFVLSGSACHFAAVLMQAGWA